MPEQNVNELSSTSVVETKGFSIRLPRTEDWLAVFLGFIFIAAVLAGYRPELPEFSWATEGELRNIVTSNHQKAETLVVDASAKGETKVVAAGQQLLAAMETGDRLAIGDASKKLASAAKESTDKSLQKKGAELDKAVGTKARGTMAKVMGTKNLLKSLNIGIVFLVISAAGIALMGGNIYKYAAGFPVVFVIAWFAQFIAGNSSINYWGLEYVVFALVIGLLISNLVPLPDWVREAVRTEYFIKTGLVILGSSILFMEIIQAGALGLLQALAVVTVVWSFSYWLATKLKVDDEFAVMLSTAVSICGVSAAIAACGAIHGDKKKLSYVTSLVLIVAVPMMVIMPWAIKALNLPDLVGGAWLGGTLDTTGSVVAAGALVSEAAMKMGVIIKFSQNVLIGVAAFFLAIWWTLKKHENPAEKPTARVIWDRFPKFVLGFIIASFVFSFILSDGTIKDTKGVLTGLRTLWFALAFTSIGLETRVKDLVTIGGGRPALAFIGAQTFNVIWTLILAYILFGGVMCAVPAIK